MLQKLNTLYLILKWQLYQKWLIKLLSKKSFKGLQNKKFSIFANNCAAGFIYKDAGVPYLTPTVGLFFHSPCYIKLLENFHLVNQPIAFVDKSKYTTTNDSRKVMNNYYPIGIIGDDIEIHFLHYKSNEEAQEKWTRRLAKLDHTNLLFLYSVRELHTEEHVHKFCQMPFKNKLCITATSYPTLKEVTQLAQFEKDGEIPGADIARIPILKKIKFAPILNNLTN